MHLFLNIVTVVRQIILLLYLENLSKESVYTGSQSAAEHLTLMGMALYLVLCGHPWRQKPITFWKQCSI